MIAVTCGDIVITRLGKVEGMVTAIIDRFGQITYEITTVVEGKFDGGPFRREEFDIKESDKKTGFIQ